MKNIILLTLFLFFASVADASVYLVINPDNDEILSMSPENDCQGADVDGEYKTIDKLTKVVKKGALTDYPLQEHPTFYKYKNDKFIMNIEKISDAEIAKEKYAKKTAEMEKIKKRANLNALKELELEGDIFTEVDEDYFGEVE